MNIGHNCFVSQTVSPEIKVVYKKVLFTLSRLGGKVAW